MSSKLSKEDFDYYLGEEPLLTDEDKEKVFMRLQGKKQQRIKPYIITSGALALSLFLAILIILLPNDEINERNQEKQNDKIEEHVDEHLEEHKIEEDDNDDIFENYLKFVEVDSREEVDAYFKELVPNINIAEELGLVTEVNQSSQIDGLEGNIHLEKIWPTSSGIYMFYSIEYEDFNKNDEYYSSFEFHVLKGDRVLLGVTNLSLRSTLYNGRIYEVAFAPSLDEAVGTEGELLIEPSIFVNSNEYMIEPMKVEYLYNRKAEESYTTEIPIEREFVINDVKVNVNRLIKKLDKTYIYFKLDLPIEHEVLTINVELFDDQNQRIESQYSGELELENNEIVMEFKALGDDLDKVTISIYNSKLVSNESFETVLDVTEFVPGILDEHPVIVRPMKRLIDSKINTNIYIDQIEYDQSQLRVSFSYEPIFGANIHLTEVWVPSLTGKQNTPIITNEKGEEHPNTLFYYLANGNIGIEVYRYFVEKSDQLHIEIKNLVYDVNINESITINLK